MSSRCLVLMAVLLGADGALAAAQAPPTPPPLRLPSGLRVRVWTASLAGQRIEGTLVSADAAGITLVPKGGNPLAPGELTLPARDVTGLHVTLKRKSHWWQGAVIGALAGTAAAFTEDVDPVLCKANDAVLCSRGEALATYGGGLAAVGAVIGALIKTDRWTPVALDALGPPVAKPVRVSRVLSLQATFRF